MKAKSAILLKSRFEKSIDLKKTIICSLVYPLAACKGKCVYRYDFQFSSSPCLVPSVEINEYCESS